MQVDEFRRVLEIGLGRIIIFLKTHDAAPYRDVILEACLHDTRYAGYVEYRRSTYLFDVISLTNDQQFYRDKILQALQNASDPNDYDVLQLVGVCNALCQTGRS